MRNTPLGEFRLTSALSARAAEIASEIGGVCHTRCPHARARGTARIGVSKPTRPSRRSAAATERLAPAADVAIFVLLYEIRIWADDGARAIARRGRAG